MYRTEVFLYSSIRLTETCWLIISAEYFFLLWISLQVFCRTWQSLCSTDAPGFTATKAEVRWCETSPPGGVVRCSSSLCFPPSLCLISFTLTASCHLLPLYVLMLLLLLFGICILVSRLISHMNILLFCFSFFCSSPSFLPAPLLSVHPVHLKELSQNAQVPPPLSLTCFFNAFANSSLMFHIFKLKLIEIVPVN